ncbi:hypothetical protein CkaCkLH20_01185 [Colletotrichum karsti]|uniref:Uncharacterized protein n=1 Tax=Colletotrichum karsti TaxID=1095194 RepID=A0A9P6IJ56_9PEZI|nr:uncharacterized protein CkaCkLH20_01185 [Colletotrichum karsti]KAF9881035.1 hypothetical protein CkaCkLH20_01185 [Colletotrichum karsti]
MRELNSNYPSRHRYAKSTGAQNSTYSQPVIVRTYSGSHSRPTSTNRSNGNGGLGSRTASSVVSGPAASVRRIIALRTPFGGSKSAQNGGLSRGMAKKRLESQEAMAKLPPVEAYSFKSMMANIESQEGDNNINADLDRIAEICARSRYSLSNQYEVHVAPHGSGASFISHASSSRRQRNNAGPTLEAVSDDDRRHRKRRSNGRRRSIAMGTLETIMSSSRSSEEDKSKKKSAAEITAEVRGRAAARKSGSTTPSSSVSERGGPSNQEQKKEPPPLERRKSSSLATAMLESTRQSLAANNNQSSPRSSANALVSELALPKTSTSHLEVRTDVEENAGYRHARKSSDERRQTDVSKPQHHETPAQPDQTKQTGSLLAGLTGWVPWRLPPIVGLGSASAQGGVPRSHAEGSLRDLLKTTDAKNKGKSVEA